MTFLTDDTPRKPFLPPIRRLSNCAGATGTASAPALCLLYRPFVRLFRSITERSKPAETRVGQQAMIVTPVRTQHLIALLSRHPSFSGAASPGRYIRISRVAGLFEDDARRQTIGMGRWRASTRKKPQVCGGPSAPMFDVEGLAHWLRSKHPRSTIHHVAAETGIASASIENWLHRRSQPSVEHFTTMLSVYGPALLQACLNQPPGWIGRAAADQRTAEIDEQIARLNRERLAVSAS